MFGLFKSKKSPIRRALEQSLSVRGTWFEWSLDDDVLTETLIVEFHYELDPQHPDFYRDGLDVIREIVRNSEPPIPKIRIVPAHARD